jgi:colanic acid biosynthesis glycosyl transferase WcaI
VSSQQSIILLYHYFHPDDVVSARLFSDLAEQFTHNGFDVTAMPSNRSCHDTNTKYPMRERWAGGLIHRVWRPAWNQQSNRGRLGNLAFMLLGWSWRAIIAPRAKRQTVIIGTDPVLGVLAAFIWRLFRPRVRIIHWCHDMYPEAAIADGMMKADSTTVRLMKWILKHAYRRCDVIADLGPCMREKLLTATGCSSASVAKTSTITNTQIESKRVYATLPPWSLVESDKPIATDQSERATLFGDAKLTLLYSGNLGRAHLFEPFLELATLSAGDWLSICFAGRGQRLAQLEAKLTSDIQNVRLAGFADEASLARRLAAADIHLVSLNPSWTGSVVPSKFFGALAAGRPVLFAGSPECGLARWIVDYQVGWVLNNNTQQLILTLNEYANDNAARSSMNDRCIEVYRQKFSKRTQLSAWSKLVE